MQIKHKIHFSIILFALLFSLSCNKRDYLNSLETTIGLSALNNWKESELKLNSNKVSANQIDSLIKQLNYENVQIVNIDTTSIYLYQNKIDNSIFGIKTSHEIYTTLGKFRSENRSKDDLLNDIFNIFNNKKLNEGIKVTRYDLNNILLSTYTGIDGNILKEATLMSFNSSTDKKNSSNIKSLSTTCTDWYWVTYINGVEVSREYVYTTCDNAAKDLPDDASANQLNEFVVDPCIEAKKINDSLNNLLNSSSFKDIMNTFNNLINKSYEYSISITRSPIDGQLSSLTPTTIYSKDSSIMNPNHTDVFAEIHNHTTETPPSEMDIYNLVSQSSIYPLFTNRFIITPSNNIFAIVIQDKIKALDFIKSHPKKLYYMPDGTKYYSFPNDVRNVYDQIYNLTTSIIDESIPTLLSYAYVFQYYDAGIYIYRKGQNDLDFNKLTPVIQASNGNDTIVYFNCY